MRKTEFSYFLFAILKLDFAYFLLPLQPVGCLLFILWHGMARRLRAHSSSSAMVKSSCLFSTLAPATLMRTASPN